MSKGYEARISQGLLKLMMRLPALRGELQIIHGHDTTLKDLAEAYEEASRTLAELRGDPGCDRRLLREYETVCADIESDVVKLCASSRPQLK
jgi:hypothetical protein